MGCNWFINQVTIYERLIAVNEQNNLNEFSAFLIKGNGSTAREGNSVKNIIASLVISCLISNKN